MTDDEDMTLFEDDVVCVNLDLEPYVLVKGYRGEFGLPVEAFTRLFAVREGWPVTEVSGPNDLSQLVNGIHTLAQALAFVDLFTSPSTHFLFAGYKHVIELTVRLPDQPTRPGAIAPETLAAWGLDLATAGEAVEHFLIQRNLLVSSDGDFEVRLVTEEVRRDGTYTETACSSVRQVGPADVIFPTYE
jgi:hypothetical protein